MPIVDDTGEEHANEYDFMRAQNVGDMLGDWENAPFQRQPLNPENYVAKLGRILDPSAVGNVSSYYNDSPTPEQDVRSGNKADMLKQLENQMVVDTNIYGNREPGADDQWMESRVPWGKPLLHNTAMLSPGRSYYANENIKMGENGTYKIYGNDGSLLGEAQLAYNAKTKAITIDMIQSYVDRFGVTQYSNHNEDYHHTIGTREMRSIIAEMKRIWPEAEKVEGIRVSGARVGPAAAYSNQYRPAMGVSIPLPKRGPIGGTLKAETPLE